ncbi:MAG: glycosyltransferase [Bacteroidales bacterium]|nr:glycosyltransferase [Bacteroidales bacterium]
MADKKIIIIGPAYPYRGGQALVEAYFHKALTEMNYDTLTISYSLLYPKVFFPGKTQYDESKIIPFEHNDKIVRTLNSINPFTWIKAFYKIKKEKPDAVIIVWWMFFFAPCLSVLSWLIKHFAKKIHICFLIENYISHENHRFERILVKNTLKFANSFIAESHYIYNEIAEDFPKAEIFEITLSVFDVYNLHRYDKSSAKEFLNIKTENVLLFFGLIRQYKGLDRLIECFDNVIEQNPNTTLLIVGECYEKLDKYLKLVNACKNKDKIIMINRFIANEDVEPYFKASDCVIMPYYSATQSGILMMAYGFSVPVITTDVGGMKELVINNETGLLIKDNSNENLLPAIDTMLKTKNKIPYDKNIYEFVYNIGYKRIGEIFKSISKSQNI